MTARNIHIRAKHFHDGAKHLHIRAKQLHISMKQLYVGVKHVYILYFITKKTFDGAKLSNEGETLLYYIGKYCYKLEIMFLCTNRIHGMIEKTTFI